MWAGEHLLTPAHPPAPLCHRVNNGEICFSQEITTEYKHIQNECLLPANVQCTPFLNWTCA